MKTPWIKPADISKPFKRLARIRAEALPPLPPPYEDFNGHRRSGFNRRPEHSPGIGAGAVG